MGKDQWVPRTAVAGEQMKLPTLLNNSLIVLAVASALSACEIETYEDQASAFNENAPPPAPPPDPGDPPPPPPGSSFGPNFSEIQSNVFTPSCATAGCHAGAGPSAGLNLDAANSYAELINIPSSQDSAIDRVEPGSPNTSYLIQKLEGTAATGGLMPPGSALPQADIDAIRQWIQDGAIDDTIVPPAAPIRVQSISPAPGATLSAAPPQIVAGFDRQLNATSVNVNTFILTAAGGDNVFDGSEPPITAFSITTPTSQSAVFDLTGVTLVDDRYRVRLLGTGGSVISDIDNNALDGEYLGRFPSGNGTAGGDFDVQFSITAPVVLQPTLDSIQQLVFQPTCATANCHGGPMPDADLDLTSADTSYVELVGVASTQDGALSRVAPFMSDNSYLIRKLENAPGIVGTVMPPTGMLDAATIATIRQWIDNGAAR